MVYLTGNTFLFPDTIWDNVLFQSELDYFEFGRLVEVPLSIVIKKLINFDRFCEEK